MRKTFTVGKVAGIPLRLHLNWAITAALVTFALAAGYFPLQRPGWEVWRYWLVASLTSLSFFGSVLLHELGHSLVALREGVPVRSITLFIFGGVAHIAKEPPTARAEIRIVGAGPLTSLLLAAAFTGVGWSGILGYEYSGAAFYLGQMNIVLALFNLLPGFPLDGGRILRASLWYWRNDFSWATRWATNAGVGVATIFVGVGIVLAVWGDFFSGGWVAFVGWYLGTAAREGSRHVGVEHRQGKTHQRPEVVLLASEDIHRMYSPAFPYRSLFSQTERVQGHLIPVVDNRTQPDGFSPRRKDPND